MKWRNDFFSLEINKDHVTIGVSFAGWLLIGGIVFAVFGILHTIKAI